MPDIYHELIISANTSKVFDSLTKEYELCQWWTPETIANAEINSILRFTFGSYYKEMRILELSEKTVRWECITGDREWIKTEISFNLMSGNKSSLSITNPEIKGQLEQLSREEDITLLIFRHANWKDYTPMFAECNYTWGQFLRSLKSYCETGKGNRWPHQHQNSNKN